MNKLQVYHFHNGTGGGVLSVIKNLLKFSVNPSLENHIIHAINKEQISTYKVEPIEGAVTQQVFYYTPKNNFYYTSKQLAKLLPSNKAVIVAHDWVELGMVSNLGLQNPVVQFLHGDYDYYYSLAKKNEKAINLFIAVCDNICVNLKQALPNRILDIHYLRFPVPDAYTANKQIDIDKEIIFIGRLTAEKGYDLLPKMAMEINKIDTGFTWHIVGQKSTNDGNEIVWPKNIKVHFYGNVDNEKVRELLTKMTFFILPSKAEGMPVSLIEAMKAGVVPIVNNLKGGIDELIQNGINGFKIGNNEVVEYASKILWSTANRSALKAISTSAKRNADLLFDPHTNTTAIESEMIKLTYYNKIVKPKKIYGSRLDQKWIPNIITKLIRSVIL